MSLLPEYEGAVHECWQEGVDLIMRASDPVLSGMPRVARTPHMSSVASSAETSIGYHGPMMQIEGRVTLDVPALLELDLQAWDSALFTCAESGLPQMMRMVFDTLDAATSQSGNVVDAKGKRLSHDVLLDALEAVHLDFSDDGTPVGLRMVVSPEMFEKIKELGPPSPEQEQRHKDIVRRKWEDFCARRRVRKLDK